MISFSPDYFIHTEIFFCWWLAAFATFSGCGCLIAMGVPAEWLVRALHEYATRSLLCSHVIFAKKKLRCVGPECCPDSAVTIPQFWHNCSDVKVFTMWA